MKSNDYLLEIGVEEVPARFMRPLLKDLEEKAKNLLDKNRLGFSAIKALGTYRRLTLIISELDERQVELTQKIKGPPAKIAIDSEGKFLAPAIGFAKKLNIDPAKLTIEEDNNCKYIFGLKKESSESVFDVLPKIMTELIFSLNLPIAMKWGSEQKTFIRPIHWLLSIYGKKIIAFDIFNISADKYTYGHRFLTKNTDKNLIASGKAIEIKEPREYEAELKANKVIVDPEKRIKIINNIIDKELEDSDKHKELIEETCFLTEYPSPIIGAFNKEYLKLPQEILIQCMKKHQKFFPITKNNKLCEKFVIVTDNYTDRSAKNIINGNENVLKARLDDVKFFWMEDTKHSLEFYQEKLKHIVFQKKMGTLFDKILRLKSLGEYITKELGFTKNSNAINRTIELCKCDLATQMVFELPVLQGTIGRLYAELQKEDKLVSNGIEEHYLPKHMGDQLPGTETGMVVSLADKIDSVVCSFYNNLIPTGSQDPWGIRRDIYGILQILIEKNYKISLKNLIDRAYDEINKEHKNKEKLLIFIEQRLKSYLIEKNIAYDTVDAVLFMGLSNPADINILAKLLDEFRQKNEASFKKLVDTAVRINRLSAKDKTQLIVNPDLFEIEIEHECWQICNNLNISELIKNDNFSEAINLLSDFCEKLISYFDQVLVMAKDENIKANRLCFLNKLNNIFLAIADFEKIVV